MKQLLFTLLFIASITHLSAKKVDGFYITLENDTVYCKMKIPTSLRYKGGPDMFKLQDELKVYINKKDTKEYKPGQIKHFSFELKGRTYAFTHIVINYSGYMERTGSLPPISNDKLEDLNKFAQVFESGNINLLYYREATYHSHAPSMGQGFSIIVSASYRQTKYYYCLQKNDESPVLVEHKNYQEMVKPYFHDCPQLQKSMDWNFPYTYIRDLVIYYNKWGLIMKQLMNN